MLPLLRCFFAHLLILQYPDHHQNLISSYLYYSGPVHKISSQSVHNFLSNVVHRQANRQTDRQTNATKNITSFAKEVKLRDFNRKMKSIETISREHVIQLCFQITHMEELSQLGACTGIISVSKVFNFCHKNCEDQ